MNTESLHEHSLWASLGSFQILLFSHSVHSHDKPLHVSLNFLYPLLCCHRDHRNNKLLHALTIHGGKGQNGGQDVKMEDKM